MRRCLSMMTLVICMMYAVAAAQAQQDADKLLSDTRWQDQAFGVSLLPPLDCKMIEQTGDDYLLRMVNAQMPYQITVAVRRSRSAQKLDNIAEMSKAQILNAQGRATLLEHVPLKVANLRAMRLYYQVEPVGNKPALIGQTLVEINPFTFAVVQVEGAAQQMQPLRAIYEAVVNSVEIADQEAIAKQREQAVTRSSQWRGRLTEREIAAALNVEQYFRITENDKDIGWMHTVSAAGEFNHLKGFRVTVETSLRLTDARLDSKAEYFTPYAGPVGEAWKVTTTLRPGNPTQPVRTIWEIGTGATDALEIRIDGTGGVESKNLRFPRPPNGYLTQAELWLLPQLLPRQAAAEFGFYCYNSNTQQLAYRYDRVTPALAGFQLASRIAPNAPELKAVCNNRGLIVEKNLGHNRKLIASNLQSLETLWKLRDSR